MKALERAKRISKVWFRPGGNRTVIDFDELVANHIRDAETDALQDAINSAKKKLPFKTSKQQNELLEYAADDLADAYRIGAEEAQHEIITRLNLLKYTG